jgi:hypothetical protein
MNAKRKSNAPLVYLVTGFAGLAALLFGQISLGLVRKLLTGRSVEWSHPPLLVLSGWILPSLSFVFAAVALLAAYATWRVYRGAWVLLAGLWSIVAALVAPLVFLEESVSPLKLIYFFGLLVVGTQTVVYLRRLGGLRPNKSLERTREG